MFRTGSLCVALGALVMFGCNSTKASTTTTTGAATSATNGAGSTTSQVTGNGTNGTNGAGSNGASTNGTGATTGPTGTSGTSATTSSNGGGSTTGDCVPDGQFASDPTQCCSGFADSSGYCGSNATNGNGSASATTSAGSTGSGSTTGPNTSGTTSGTNGAISFGGGWIPDDAGYTPATDGGGATIVVIDTGADASSSSKFGGGTDPNAPQIVYPPNGVLVPPNMNSLEFHFIPGAGQTLFKLELHSPTATMDIYTGCTAVGSGCVYSTGATFWSQFVNTARGTAPVTYTISGVNGTSPGAVGTSAQQTIAFSDQDITGGIYFWNTSGEVDRYDWGLPGSAPETWMAGNPVSCVGCHVLSREGNKAIVDRGIPSPQTVTNSYVDVATTQPLTTSSGTGLSGGGNLFFSFSPGGGFALFSNGNKIGWRDLSSGAVLGTNITSGSMPDWSPSGNDMVFAKPQQNPFIGEPGVTSASIETMHFNGFGWDPAAPLVSFSGENNYYPAYAPTGDWVAFNRSPSNVDSFSNSPGTEMDGGAPDGELWAVAAAGGTPVRMDAASNPGALSWPKWAPVVGSYYGGKVMWLTFSSDRAYGLRLGNNQETQLWMTAFDPDVAAGGVDPSFPAFYFPYQDIGGGNHIAQWVTTIVRQDCTTNSDCPSKDTCQAGKCVPGQFTHGLPVAHPPKPKSPHGHH
ncbi:MAG: hypothetical protein JST54_00760 [Deltaproteobacteria bacterium]|nr:hypothetical protein [Deltaproteobacteria bacterium]